MQGNVTIPTQWNRNDVGTESRDRFYSKTFKVQLV